MLHDQSIDPNQRERPGLLMRPLIAVWHWMVPPTQAHRDRESRTRVIVRSSIVATLTVGFIVGVFVWGRDIRDYYQDWRADRLVKEAKALADEGNMLNAVFKAQEAYSLSPENEEAIRQNAKFLTLMKRQEAVYFSERLEKKGKATLEDKEWKVKALLNLNRQKEAADALMKRMKSNAPTDATFKLAEEVWGGREQNKVVLGVLKDYCDKNPEDLQSLLRLSKMRLASKDPLDQSAGMAALWKIAEEKTEVGLKAIEALDEIKVLSPDEAAKLIERLENHPKGDGWHQIAALRRRIAMQPTRRTQIVQEAVLRARSLKREEKLPFVRWLVEEHEFLNVAALVDETDAKAYKPLLENYLTALTMLGRFDDLSRLVEDPKVAEILNKTTQAFYRAHLAFVKGKPKEEVREKLMAARIAAEDEGRGDMLLAVAAYAEKRGILDVAEDAFGAASRYRKTERYGYEGLVRITRANGNEDVLLTSAREAVRRWPDDENFMEQFLYANLVTGRDVELSLERTLTLLAKRPDDSTVKVAAALGYYWFGDLDMATNHMQHVDLNQCTSGQQAVFAFLAKLGGYDSAADTVINAIPADAKMLPQETAFLKKTKEPRPKIKTADATGDK